MKKKIIILSFLIAGIIGSITAINELPLNTTPFKIKKQFVTKSTRSSDAVFGIGAQFSALKLFGTGSPSLKGFGINALLSPNGEKNAFFAEFNYYLPGELTSSNYAYAFSSATSPSSLDITVKTKISGIGFRVGFRRYMIKEVSEEGFKLYFQAHAGLLLFSGKSTSSGFDPNLYYATYEPTSTAYGFTIGGGFGGEYCIAEKINIFLEGNLLIPANNVNGEEVEVQIPISFQSVVGVRFHF